jgi:hypothetical protein
VPDLPDRGRPGAEGVIVLHYEADVDRIAAVTGQRSEWSS